MKIIVLSAGKRLFKSDKTEYISETADALRQGDNSVEFKQVFSGSYLLERELLRAAKSKPDLIVVENSFSGRGNDEFRKKFAYIIDRGEHKIQKPPSAKKKGRRRKGEAIEEISYMRKKTHIFTLGDGNNRAYLFSYMGTRVAVLPKNYGVAAELPEQCEVIFAENEEKYPGGYSLSERKLRVLTFFERHFPIKSDPGSEKIRKSVVLAALCAFIVAGYFMFLNLYYMPMHNEAIMSELQDIFYGTEEQGGGKTAKKTVEHDWATINKKYPDIKAWIKVDNTVIDYPVLWHKGDDSTSQYYLWRNYKGETYGEATCSIFIDYRSKQAMKSRNVILHGHNMLNGSMFAALNKYGNTSPDMKVYKKSPIIRISTKDGGNQVYKIFSVFKSNVNKAQGEYFDFYAGTFKSDAQFMNYVYNLKIRSMINCPVSVNEDDQLLTLVTCSNDNWPEFRTVVVARKCRDGESAKVDTSKASVAKNPVWPQYYYNVYGGTRPTVSTFKTEYKKGNIKWYDGNGRLKGKERLPVTYREPTEPTTATKDATATQPTTAAKKMYHVRIYYGGRLRQKGNIREGLTVTLPKVKNYSTSAYRYTFTGWRVNKRITLGKNTKTYKIKERTIIRATYNRTKIKKTTPTKPATKPATKPTKPATKPTKPAETTPPATQEVEPTTEPQEE